MKVEDEHIELDLTETGPSPVHTMISIERSMQAAVNRLRSIKGIPHASTNSGKDSGKRQEIQ